MIHDFVKFPSTPHLLWLGKDRVRIDKVLTQAEAEAFLSESVIVEEKVDGANLGISFDSEGKLLAQNRGSFLNHGTRGQFSTLWAWLSQHETRLFDVLGDRLILFGEWCYAEHSIAYTLLPDFFLAFDIFDRQNQSFMSSARREEIAGLLQVATVPKVYRGIVRLDDVPSLIGKSSLYDGPMEGVYLRQERVVAPIQRAKVVRAEFVQQIGEHWSKRPIVPNRLHTNTEWQLTHGGEFR